MNVALAGQLRHFVNDGKSVEWGLDTAEVMSVVQFRGDMSLLADHIVNRFGLPKPGNTGCMWWDQMQGRQRALHHKDLHKKSGTSWSTEVFSSCQLGSKASHFPVS